MHDDLVDALAYVDQVAVVTYADARDFEDSWEPLDAITGY
jgi:hypothetical protein